MPRFPEDDNGPNLGPSLDELKTALRRKLNGMGPDEREASLRQLEGDRNFSDVVQEYRYPTPGAWTEEAFKPTAPVKIGGYLTRKGVTTATDVEYGPPLPPKPQPRREVTWATSPAAIPGVDWPGGMPTPPVGTEPYWRIPTAEETIKATGQAGIEFGKTVGRTFQGKKPFGLFEIGKPEETPPPEGLPEMAGRMGAGFLGFGEPLTLEELRQQPWYMQTAMATSMGAPLESLSMTAAQAPAVIKAATTGMKQRGRAVLATGERGAVGPFGKGEREPLNRAITWRAMAEGNKNGQKITYVTQQPDGRFALTPSYENQGKGATRQFFATKEEALAELEKYGNIEETNRLTHTTTPLAKPPIIPQKSAAGLEVGAAKEPWQMTYKEWYDSATPTMRRNTIYEGNQFHHDLVKEVLSEGKPVPPEVLAEYPDLAAKALPKAEAGKPERVTSEIFGLKEMPEGVITIHRNNIIQLISKTEKAIQSREAGLVEIRPKAVGLKDYALLRSEEESLKVEKAILSSAKDALSQFDEELRTRGLMPPDLAKAVPKAEAVTPPLRAAVPSGEWQRMTTPQRIAAVRSVGLEDKVAMKAWDALTPAEREALTGTKPLGAAAKVKPPVEAVKEPWGISREEFINNPPNKLSFEGEEYTWDTTEKVYIFRWKGTDIDGKPIKGFNILKPDRAHRELVKRYLEEGTLSIEDYNRLHAKDYGKAETLIKEKDRLVRQLAAEDSLEMGRRLNAIRTLGYTDEEIANLTNEEIINITNKALPKAEAKLPRELTGAKPRYTAGVAGSYEPQFESDIDKALYIVAQTTKSARDADYMAWLKTQFPSVSEADIRAMGVKVKQNLKGLVKGQPEGPIVIPDMGFKMDVISKAAAPAAAKEPWLMTLDEYITPWKNKGGEINPQLAGGLRGNHQNVIRQALSEGKLSVEDYNRLHAADYGPIEQFAPDLAAKAAAKVEAAIPAAEEAINTGGAGLWLVSEPQDIEKLIKAGAKLYPVENPQDVERLMKAGARLWPTKEPQNIESLMKPGAKLWLVETPQDIEKLVKPGKDWARLHPAGIQDLSRLEEGEVIGFPYEPKVVVSKVKPPPGTVPPAPVVTPEGRLWLPEPPRTGTYIESARKEVAGSFRKKTGVFDIVEQAHQQVLKARDLGENAINYVGSYLRQAGNMTKEFGLDAQGIATKVGNPEGRSLAINDILSNYTHYTLTPAQAEIAKRQGFVYREALRLAKSYGVEISELGNLDEYWQYIARRVKGKLNPATGQFEMPPSVTGGFRMGAKISAQKERIFEEMAQGVDLGLLYEHPDQVMVQHLKGIYRLIGNKQAEDTVKGLTRAITEEAPVVFGERALAQPALRSRAAAVDLANAIDRIFTPEQEIKALRVMADISGAMVGQTAALDVSAPFIQGLLVLGHDLKNALIGRPTAVWAKAYARMWRAVWNPETIDTFRIANHDLYKRAQEAGIIIGQSEFVSGVPLTGKVLGKIPVAGKTFKEAYKQSWGRAGQAYSDFLEVSRIKMFEQMEGVWERSGGNIYDLGAVVNRMTGATSAAARGVGANRRLGERIIAFAPNYLRASLLLIKDMAGRGATAKEVQSTLATMLGVGFAVYYAEEKVRGRDPKIRPWPKRLGGDGADAFTTEINGYRVGLGSWMYSMIKTLAEVGAIAADDPSALVVFDDQHPLMRFAKSKQGPALSLTRELATGKNFWGQDFETPQDYLLRIAESLTPISAQSLVQKGTGLPKTAAERATPLALDPLGLRVFPSNTAKFTKLAEEMGIAKGREWAELEPREIARISMSPEGRTLIKALRQKETVARWQIRWDAYDVQLKRDTELKAGKVKGSDWKDAYYQAQSVLAAQLGRFDEDFKRMRRDPETPEDKAISGYYDTMDKAKSETGVFDGDKWEDLKKQFMASLTPQLQKYVEDNIGIYDTPQAKTFRNIRKLLEPYWDMEDRVWAMFGADGQALKARANEIEVLATTNERAAKAMLTTDIVRAQKQILSDRTEWRRQNPGLSEILRKYYSY